MISLSQGERRFCLGLLAVPVGILMDVFYFFVAMVLSSGHSIVPLILLFPYSAIPQRFGFAPSGVLNGLLGIAQFPAYCLIMATVRRPHQLITRLVGICVAHAITVAVCLPRIY
jgi:hypothetical protein